MRRITLVATKHREQGQCNESELLKIIEDVNAEVIFEEIRPSDFEANYRDKARHTLEMRAIVRCLMTKPVRQVPVDDFVIPATFAEQMMSLEHHVQSNNAQYCELMDEINRKIHLLGFSYLNNGEFDALIKRADDLFEEIVTLTCDDHQKATLATWNSQIRGREQSMIKNIYRFCQTNHFTEGLFLVGAGHVPAIIEEIKSRMKAEPDLVDWKLWGRPS